MKPQTASPVYFKARSRRFNPRAIILLALIGLLIGYPVYVYLDNRLSAGIREQGDLLWVDLKSMSSFEMDQDAGTNAQIPQVYRNLDGKRVRLIGQMWSPLSVEGSVRNFVLVYSINNCCFNGPPKVQHLVQSTVLPGQRVEVWPDFVAVTGRLHVSVQSDAGHVQSVYRIDVERVVPQ